MPTKFPILTEKPHGNNLRYRLTCHFSEINQKKLTSGFSFNKKKQKIISF